MNIHWEVWVQESSEWDTILKMYKLELATLIFKNVCIKFLDNDFRVTINSVHYYRSRSASDLFGHVMRNSSLLHC